MNLDSSIPSNCQKEFFNQPHALKTAVLFLIFNRLDTAKKVFKAIRQAKPPRLYIAADGARTEKNAEEEKVNAVREYITSNIDWDCEVKTLFRDQNLGCKMAVSGAIDWFFENEEMGIILEDDCLPSQSFFWFCEELLERYKDDYRVWHISGDNFQQGIKRDKADYYFSKFVHIWGWATWADRWQSYDVGMDSFKDFEEAGLIKSVWPKVATQKNWINTFKKVYSSEIDTWDYQWVYTCWRNNGLSVLPNKNLVKNIGFGIDATHTVNEDSNISNLEIHEVIFPLIHTEFVLPRFDADEYSDTLFSKKRNIALRVINKLSRKAIGKNIL